MGFAIQSQQGLTQLRLEICHQPCTASSVTQSAAVKENPASVDPPLTTLSVNRGHIRICSQTGSLPRLDGLAGQQPKNVGVCSGQHGGILGGPFTSLQYCMLDPRYS